MNRLHVATRGIGNWRERLADPERQWRRGYSAFETAVSWESTADTDCGLPTPIAELFERSNFGAATLGLAVGEHKVRLPGGNADSQCDVWALINTGLGTLSLAVEAKAREPFGPGNETLAAWRSAAETEQSKANRDTRWRHIAAHLPAPADGNSYSTVAYQILHRCAASVIEAGRLGLPNAAFVVQAFNSPDESFKEFERLCRVLGIKAERGRMQIARVGSMRLGIGWADCPLATDTQIAAIA